MLIVFYDSKGIIHKEFVQPGQIVNALYYVGVLKRLLSRIRRIRPEYRDSDSWRLLHDNGPSHSATIVSDYLAKNHISLINHFLYSPDLAHRDYFLFPAMHLKKKEIRFT